MNEDEDCVTIKCTDLVNGICQNIPLGCKYNVDNKTALVKGPTSPHSCAAHGYVTPVEIVKQYLLGKHVTMKEYGTDMKEFIVQDVKKDADWEWVGFEIITTDGRRISLEVDDQMQVT